MRRLMKVLDEVALYLGILTVTYLWLGFVIVSILSYINKE